MTEISDSELDSPNDYQIEDTSGHEDSDDSNTFDSDQEEEDYGAFQDFDGFSNNPDNQDSNQNFAPSTSKEKKIEGLTMNGSNIELADDITPFTFCRKFEEFPEEIQMKIWRFSALQCRRTIVMKLQEDTFKFENRPSTPAFMHACHRARKYGLECFFPVDEKGVPHNFTEPDQVDKSYFYVNPVSDDFILKFGDEGSCPSPVYCPIQYGSEYMQEELAIEEQKLHESDCKERFALYDAIATRGRVPLINNTMPIGYFNGVNVMISQNPAATATVVRHILRYPGEPVFPPASVLPHFFTSIRSVGINLQLDFSPSFDFTGMNVQQLQLWAEDAVKYKFDRVFKEILDYFPHLEYTFAVVRAYGRSNRGVPDRGFQRGLEKSKWTSVGMTKGRERRMGYDEFKQFESQAKVWLMHERINRGMYLSNIDFELYVQTSILWDI